jgi:hypothetical protein
MPVGESQLGGPNTSNSQWQTGPTAGSSQGHSHPASYTPPQPNGHGGVAMSRTGGYNYTNASHNHQEIAVLPTRPSHGVIGTDLLASPEEENGHKMTSFYSLPWTPESTNDGEGDKAVPGLGTHIYTHHYSLPLAQGAVTHAGSETTVEVGRYWQPVLECPPTPVLRPVGLARPAKLSSEHHGGLPLPLGHIPCVSHSAVACR